MYNVYTFKSLYYLVRCMFETHKKKTLCYSCMPILYVIKFMFVCWLFLSTYILTKDRQQAITIFFVSFIHLSLYRSLWAYLSTTLKMFLFLMSSPYSSANFIHRYSSMLLHKKRLCSMSKSMMMIIINGIHQQRCIGNTRVACLMFSLH